MQQQSHSKIPDLSPICRSIAALSAVIYVGTVPLDILALPGGLTLTTYAAAILLGAWVFATFATGRLQGTPGNVVATVLAFAVWATFTVYWSPPKGGSASYVLSLWGALLAFLFLSYLLPYARRAALTAYVASSSAVSFVLIQSSRINPLGTRSTIGTADENFAAYAVSVGAAIALFLFLHSKKPISLVMLTLAVVQGAGALVTGSRAGLIALISTVLVALVLSFRLTPLRAFALAVVSATLVVLAREWEQVPVRLIPFLKGEIVFLDPGRQSIDLLFVAKQDQWLIKGVGYGASAEFLNQSDSLYARVHNLPLSLLVETGLVGFLLFLAVSVAILQSALPGASLLFVGITAAPTITFAASLGGLERSAIMWTVLAMWLAAAANQSLTPQGTGLRSLGQLSQSHNPLGRDNPFFGFERDRRQAIRDRCGSEFEPIFFVGSKR